MSGPRQISKMESLDNSERILAGNYRRKKLHLDVL